MVPFNISHTHKRRNPDYLYRSTNGYLKILVTRIEFAIHFGASFYVQGTQ